MTSYSRDTLHAQVSDRAGNITTQDSSFIVDLTPPVLSIVAPADGSTLNQSSISATITYSDALSGIDLSTFAVSLDGQDVTKTFAAGPVSASATLSVAVGPHQLDVQIADLAANVARAHSSFTVAGANVNVGMITAGWGHTCALVNGGVQCWGINHLGELGNNSTTTICPAAVGAGIPCSTVPVQVSGLTSGVTAISAGSGGAHTCALVNGGVQCWGDNDDGQLGNNSTSVCFANSPCSYVPVPVSGLTSGVTAVSAGASHTCALVNGGVQCWGDNAEGELGNNSTTQSTVPVPVSGLTSGVTAIAAGESHTCALVNGGVQCWGDNPFGELGNNSTTRSTVPVQVSGLTSGVTAIAAGGEFACALVNGGVQCWGSNAFGELGNNSTTTICAAGIPCSTVPVQVSGLTSGVTAIAAGESHTCALVNGGLQCWGANATGQLGNNSTGVCFENSSCSTVPVQVSGLASGVTAIAAGGFHTCALVNGGLQCWGDNYTGQLGNNSTTQSSVPVHVSGL